MIKHKILCEICDEPLARAYLPNLARPLVASMFSPIEEGYLEPFPDPNMTWEWMKCPHCKARPFIVTEKQASDAVEGKWPGPEQVKTLQGVYRIYEGVFPGVQPGIVISCHTDEELEKEWETRKRAAAKPSAKSSTETPKTAKDTSSSPSPPTPVETRAQRKAKRKNR